jgi:hypothetical protein
VLSLKSNNLQAAGGKALAEGLKGNQVITELDISSNNLGLNSDDDTDTSGIIALADAIPDMRALSSVNVLSNVIPVEQAQELVKIMWSKDTLTTLCGLTGLETELDFSKTPDGHNHAGDAVLIANDISEMRALSTFTFSGDYTGNRSKPVTMETTMTEADFSGKGLGASGGMMIAAFLPKCQ